MRKVKVGLSPTAVVFASARRPNGRNPWSGSSGSPPPGAAGAGGKGFGGGGAGAGEGGGEDAAAADNKQPRQSQQTSGGDAVTEWGRGARRGEWRPAGRGGAVGANYNAKVRRRCKLYSGYTPPRLESIPGFKVWLLKRTTVLSI